MNKTALAIALGIGVYGAKRYLQSYANRQRLFDAMDDAVSFIKKSVKRGFEQDAKVGFSSQTAEIFYGFESAKSKSFEIFFELQKALTEIKNINLSIVALRITPFKEDYSNFNASGEILELLSEFSYILSQANKLVDFTLINDIASFNDDFASLDKTQAEFLLELINLNNLAANALSCPTLNSNGEEISERAKRAFQRLKVKLG